MESLSYKIVACIGAVILIAALRHSRAISDGSQSNDNQVITISAASYAEVVAPESIAASYGRALATETKVADKTPLPTSLAGTTVKVRDSTGAERFAPLFAVVVLNQDTAACQVNYQVPLGTATGAATITITNGAGVISTGTAQIASVALGLFAANADGQGVAVASALRVKTDGARSEEPIFQFDPAQMKFVPRPFHLGPDLGNASDQVFLVLYGTGIRGRRDPAQVSASVGSVNCEVLYAGAQGGLVGVDQVNVRVPRELAGRGQTNLILNVAGFGSSNQLQIEITVPPCARPPIVGSFNPTTVLAGERLEINGSNFSSTPSDNLVRIAGTEATLISASANQNQLIVKVPHGAATGPITVRVAGCECVSATPISLVTSVSGVVQNTRLNPLRGVTVRIRAANVEKLTDAEGAFTLPNIPPSPQHLVEIDGSTVPVTPKYEKIVLPLPVLAGRDNTFSDPIRLQQPTGPGLFFPSFTEPGDGARAASFPSTLNRSISTDNATFEVRDNTTAIFPDGATSGTVTLTEVESSRTPVGLPAGVFSSVIIQLTPVRVKLRPGGKLTFRNKDNLSVDAPVKLYRFDQTAGSPTIGQFVVHGSATVSADGKQVETAADAINETSYFLVAAPRPTTTVIGRVVDSDSKTPVRNALLTARGRETFSDGNGGFTLRNIVISGDGDPLTVEASFHRPDGRVDRVDRGGISAVANGMTRVTPDIVLPSGNRPPAIIVSPVLSVTRGTPREVDFVASDPDPGQTVQVAVEGADFAAVSKVSESAYRLRLTPGAGTASSYTLTIKATDNLGLSVTEKIMLMVFDNRPPVLDAPAAIGANSRQKLSFTISAFDPDEGQTFTFLAAALPQGATFDPATREFSWTPGLTQTGSYTASFKVSDNGLPALSNSKDVTIRVVGQWTQTSGPEGGPIRAFLVNGATLFAGTQGGVFRSTDPGQNWTALTGGEVVRDVNALEMREGDLFAGTRGGVYRFSGGSWSNVSDGLPVSARDVRTLIVSDTNLYAGTWRSGDNGVYVLPANSQVWTRIVNDLPLGKKDLPPELHVLSLAVRSGSLYAGTKGGGVYQLSNGMWTQVLKDLAVRVLEVNGTTLFAGTDGGVFRSLDGTNWTPFNTGLANFDIHALRVNGANLFAGTKEGGVFRTPVSADDWKAANTNIANASVIALAASASGANLFAGTLDGVFLSPNQGQSWAPANSGLRGTIVYAFAMTDKGLFAGMGTDDSLVGSGGGGIFYLPNNGLDWLRVINGLPLNFTVSSFFVNGADLFAGTNKGVFLLTDNGQRWVNHGNGLPNGPVQSLVMIGTDMFAGIYGSGVYRLRDQGGNWEPFNDGLLRLSIVSLVASGRTLFAGEQSTGVFRLDLSNQPQRWEKFNKDLTVTPPPNTLPVLEKLAVSGTYLFAATRNGGVFRTLLNADNWTPVNTGLGGSGVFVVVVSGTNLFAGTGLGRGVFLSVNQGESWIRVSGGLPALDVFSLAVSGNNLFAGTEGGGVFTTQF